MNINLINLFLVPNESHPDLNGNHRFTEHQRLL